MSSPARTVSPVPPTAAVIILAFKNAGVPAFYDQDDCAVYAHPAAVPESRALDAEHIMIEWTPSDPAPGEARLKATAWVPDGPPDFDQVGTVYTTAEQGPLADEAAQCARAVAQWFAKPRPKARAVLLAALAEYGITPGDGRLFIMSTDHSDSYDVLLPFPRDTYGRLVIADRDGSVEHPPAAHTGWSITLHDERGEAVGDPVYIAGDGGLVDCAEDSAAAAATVADWLTSPVSRHCDCYAQDGHWRRHDRECNRYRRP